MFVFFVVEREEKGPKKMITGISGFGFFRSKKNGRFVTHNCFPKNCYLKPLFLLCFGGARVLGQDVKKGKFWTPTKKGRKMTDNCHLTWP